MQTLTRERQTLEDQGYVVLRGAVDPAAVATALRRLNLAIRQHRLTTDDIWTCQLATFFPHLRWEPDVLKLRAAVEGALAPRQGEEWADPQLLLRFPDEAQDWPLTPHVDGLPPWATGRSYRAIAGVALSSSRGSDGCVAVWPGSHAGAEKGPRLVELDAGDVLVMHPALWHSSTLNRGGRVRYAIYFRLLAATSSSGCTTP